MARAANTNPSLQCELPIQISVVNQAIFKAQPVTVQSGHNKHKIRQRIK